MKMGKNLQELAYEVQQQQNAKRDYIVDERGVTMSVNGSTTELGLMGIGEFGLTGHCHRQVADRLNIPFKYYERMQTEMPDLLCENVNRWMSHSGKRRLVRTFDASCGMKARAFLSDKYRMLDNYDLAKVVLPKIQEMGCKIESCDLTEKNLYLKFFTDKVQANVVGDVVRAGGMIRNSEVGCGMIEIVPMMEKLSCTNGMVIPASNLRKYHVGKKNDVGGDSFDGASELFRSETREADDKVFWMKVADVIGAVFSKEKFWQMTRRIEVAAGNKIEGDPVKMIETTATKYGMSEEERGGVLRHLIEGKDLSQYGLVNAVTRTSQDIGEYERATDFERFGGELLYLTQKDWGSLAN